MPGHGSVRCSRNRRRKCLRASRSHVRRRRRNANGNDGRWRTSSAGASTHQNHCGHRSRKSPRSSTIHGGNPHSLDVQTLVGEKSSGTNGPFRGSRPGAVRPLEFRFIPAGNASLPKMEWTRLLFVTITAGSYVPITVSAAIYPGVLAIFKIVPLNTLELLLHYFWWAELRVTHRRSSTIVIAYA